MDELQDASAEETTRQRLTRWLMDSEYSFEDLRSALELNGRQLEEELRHVERSGRSLGMSLQMVPPRCRDCGFAFPGRTRRHLRTPGRCPECHGQRIEAPRFRICATGGR